MLKEKFFLIVFTTLITAVIYLVGCSINKHQSKEITQINLTPDQIALAQKLLEERCTVCHNLKKVYDEKTNRAGWIKYIDSMIKKGAQLNAEERSLLINYLSTRETK
ncbi:MAG: hypothetical protein ACUVWN_05930 [bacterium]